LPLRLYLDVDARGFRSPPPAEDECVVMPV
jgi:hypothetical protein